MENSFGDFYLALQEAADLYVLGLETRSAERKQAYLLIFLASIISLLVISIIITPVFRSVNKQKDKVLSLFCEIDDTNIRILMQKCERFLNKLETDDIHNDMDSNEDIEGNILEDGEEDSHYVGSSRRIKRAKNTTRTQSSFYLKFFVAVATIEAYYLSNYCQSRLFSESTLHLKEVANVTTVAEPFYWLMLNSQREMLVHRNRQVLGQEALQLSIQGLQEMFLLNNLIELTFLQNIDFLSPQFTDAFLSSMNNDSCELMGEVTTQNSSLSGYLANQTDCEKFISGSTQNGLSTIIVRYSQTLRLTLTQYLNKTSQPKANQTAVALELLNSPSYFELYLI
eukprot:CAMPEP_0202978106 /NCGR_PEP_ID=MMETSP1396-20130829/84644_1 /ASSEMBLY_ACC=CAM_ASM_000872 /TAXON_ID= /ORGANISM="Pseudokeronopsis sp., Strain Brazil" /LENGTH=339 /DNA_ID=CAMNT_0049716975 /DNA_START=635 /DNA_END=1654 /DNA_ORIENTATION=-